MRWLAVNAKQTVLLPDVLAEQTSYPAPICASVAVSAITMRTHNKYETDDDDDDDDDDDGNDL